MSSEIKYAAIEWFFEDFAPFSWRRDHRMLSSGPRASWGKYWGKTTNSQK
jgi:hypothetical protein